MTVKIWSSVTKQLSAWYMVNVEPTNFNITTLDVLKQVFIVSKKHPLALRDTVTMKELENMPLIVPNERCRSGEYIRSMFEERGLNLTSPMNVTDLVRQLNVVSNNPNLAARIILDDVIAQDLEHIKVLGLGGRTFSSARLPDKP